jgi:hypothetical protein
MELNERSYIIVKIPVIFSLILAGYWLTKLITGGIPVSPVSRVSYALLAAGLTMIMAPFNLYKNYNHPKRGIDYANLPASVTEKFLSMQINCIVILPLISLLSVLLTDFVLSLVTPGIFPGRALTSISLTWDNASDALILQQAFILGNFLFKKNKVFKTIISCIGFYIVVGLVIALTIFLLYKDTPAFQASGNIIHISGIEDLRLMLGKDVENTYKWIIRAIQVIYILLPVLFVSSTFYKIKTQQYR